jgi:hypothetical protein
MSGNPENQNSLENQEVWEDCPAGEITGMLSRVKNHRRKVVAAQIAGLSVLGILVGIVFVEMRSTIQRENATYAGISCREVRENAKKYLDDNISGELKDRITAHLGECASCKKMVREMNPKSKGGSGLNKRPVTTAANNYSGLFTLALTRGP